jgi:hypothetical protein
MPTFRVEWTVENWFRTYIVAESQQEAIDKWSSGNYDDYSTLDPYDIYVQDGVDVEMIEEEE